MNEKQKDPIFKEKKVNTTLVDYKSLNDLYKYFVPQKQFSVEQAFWLPISKPVSEQPLVQTIPVKTDVPRELPTRSLVKKSFQKLKIHLDNFDKVVKVKTKVTAQNEGTWGFKYIRKAFEKNVIPFMKSLRESFQDFKINEMKAVFNQMAFEVEQCYVDTKCFEIQKKELFLEIDQLLELIISQDIVHTVVNSYAAIVDYVKMEKSFVDEYNECLKLKTELSKKNEMVEKAVYNELPKRCSRIKNHCIYLEIEKQQLKEIIRSNKPCQNQNAPEFKEFFEINNLKAQLKGRDTTISNLKKHIANMKEKVVADCSEYVNNSRVIAPGMYKLDLQPLSSTLRKNKEVHEDYLKVTKEHADTLRGIVEQAKALEPSDNALDYACKYAQRIQELLVCVNASCPSCQKDSEKPVAAKTKNMFRRVTFEDNRVISFTSASGSKSKSNTRKNRITQPASSNQRNKKVEDHPRSIMSTSNKKNHVSICNLSIKHAVLDANSKFVCSTCNDCLFYANHGKCVVTYLNDVNLGVKSKSGKSIKKEWKTTGKVFTSVGHRWLPTGRTFTIDGTKCPMTRIISTKVVPPRESIQPTVITKITSSSASNRKPKVTKSISSSRTYHPLFIGTVRFGNDQVGRIMGYGDYQIGNVIISRVYYVEGLGHNLFSVGQFCDSDFEVAFQKHTCFVHNLEASKTKSWLWHRMLSHLNFGTINELAKQGLVRGLPKLKYEKDHLWSACSLGKSKKHTHKPKSEDSIQEKLYLLHMDLCSQMRIESINGKKYILVIFDDYS
ncbi:retrovirus-related pol polyprotein from transposon TNT 1-94 [Tanacetum coccineum]